ncbi:MAG: DEAD/DEAH box helicase [Actinomycetota bacterium]|nr:DEAD/DEAH box helicase [Actinomycetota bacterium]
MNPPTFADLGVPADLVDALAARSITEPFAIQAAALPDALDGRDVTGRAPTGSGKTLAFGIPLVARTGGAAKKRPQALVLAPTRELAEQISRELTPLANARDLRVLAVYGGVGLEPQRRQLARGVEILVACPGRLEDLLSQGALTLGDVTRVVVDEADRMADMGFLPAVRRVLDQTNRDRQTVLFSATLEGDVAQLIDGYQQDPVRHEVGEATPDISSARHLFWEIERPDRSRRTAELVAAAGPTVVFCRTRRGADRVAKQLDRLGVASAAIHGGRSQGQRDRALGHFSRGAVHALVATDVAARGIHVDGVACVVHYDPCDEATTYVHRSGRTARAGASGLVVSLVDRSQVRDVRKQLKPLGVVVDAGEPTAELLGDPSTLTRVAPAPERTGDGRGRGKNRSGGARRGESRGQRDGGGDRRPNRRRGRDDGGRSEGGRSDGRTDGGARADRDGSGEGRRDGGRGRNHPGGGRSGRPHPGGRGNRRRQPARDR